MIYIETKRKDNILVFMELYWKDHLIPQNVHKFECVVLAVTLNLDSFYLLISLLMNLKIYEVKKLKRLFIRQSSMLPMKSNCFTFAFYLHG